MTNTHSFSKGEEIANAITHGIGAVLSIAALVILIVFASLYGSAWHVVSFTIYGVTMMILYFSSTLLHSFPKGKVKDLFEIFDHSAIYLFIAGTYTPLLLVVLRGALGWTLFGIIWGLTITGIIFKVFFVKRFIILSTIVYIIMGWLIIFAFKPILQTISTTGIATLVIGGIFYTAGTIFYVWRKIPYHHAIWHLFVLAGSIAHFFAILFYVLPIN